MSHKNYSEQAPTDSEIVDFLEEIYPEDVTICGQSFSQAYALKRLDRISFDMVASNLMDWYSCDECNTVYKDEDAEEKARECCQNYCKDCDEPLYKDENCDDTNSGLCWDCEES